VRCSERLFESLAGLDRRERIGGVMENEQAPPAVRDLKQMLQYQEGSVVSRVLVKNAGGTVTLFAFAAGEGLSEHTAPFDALVVGVEGKAEIDISHVAYAVGEGETLLLPANQPHAVRALGEFKMLLIMIRA
jgi:quercetin dioxygenase-like cupin family protein